MAHAKRTRHKSKSGKALYAKRNKKGQFADIQSVSKAVKADRKRKAKNAPKKKGQGYAGDYAAKKKSKGVCGWLKKIFE